MHDDDSGEIERLVRAARPVPLTADPAVLAALDELDVAVARRAWRRRGWMTGGRRRVRTSVLLAAALVTVGTAAVAVTVGARTGWFTEPGSESDATEWVNTTADDYRAVVTELAPAYVTYPPGVSVSDAVAWVTGSTSVSGGLVQVTGIHRAYETYAQCSWVRAWEGADTGEALRSVASREIAASVTWPAFAATDGGGIRDTMDDLSEAVATDDVRAVPQLAAVVCPGDLLGDR